MTDYCSSYNQVVGIKKAKQEAENTLRVVEKINDNISIWLKIKGYIVNFIVKRLRFLKKIKCIRAFILPYAQYVSKIIYYKNLYFYIVSDPNPRIINLKIPGAYAQMCLDRIMVFNDQNNNEYKKEKFRYVIKAIRQIIISHYPDLKIDFPSDQKLKKYDDHYKWLNEILYPTLEKYKEDLRGFKELNINSVVKKCSVSN